MRLELTEEARLDLIDIEATGIERFGTMRAEAYLDDLFGRFDRLIGFPDLGAKRVSDIDVQVLPHGSHVILYQVEDEAVRILRVRHGREDWLRQLSQS